MLPLDPTQPLFTWPNARACAERCALAYDETDRSVQERGINARVVTNAATDTEALVVNEGDCISVAFRGSCCLCDWIQDFKARPEHPRKGLTWSDSYEVEAEVHEGFFEDVESISAELILAIRNIGGSGNSPLRPIFLTGHSKGAAEATLFALELQRQIGMAGAGDLPRGAFALCGVYLFGCPRVGNRAFANIYNETLFEETFRVVNENDIVPRVPGVLMGYRHCGQEIFLPVGGGCCENPSLGFKLLNDALGLWSAYRREKFAALDVLVADHALGAYQKRIQFL